MIPPATKNRMTIFKSQSGLKWRNPRGGN